jgi:hypothetical protein
MDTVESDIKNFDVTMERRRVAILRLRGILSTITPQSVPPNSDSFLTIPPNFQLLQLTSLIDTNLAMLHYMLINSAPGETQLNVPTVYAEFMDHLLYLFDCSPCFRKPFTLLASPPVFVPLSETDVTNRSKEYHQQRVLHCFYSSYSSSSKSDLEILKMIMEYYILSSVGQQESQINLYLSSGIDVLRSYFPPGLDVEKVYHNVFWGRLYSLATMIPSDHFTSMKTDMNASRQSGGTIPYFHVSTFLNQLGEEGNKDLKETHTTLLQDLPVPSPVRDYVHTLYLFHTTVYVGSQSLLKELIPPVRQRTIDKLLLHSEMYAKFMTLTEQLPVPAGDITVKTIVNLREIKDILYDDIHLLLDSFREEGNTPFLSTVTERLGTSPAIQKRLTRLLSSPFEPALKSAVEDINDHIDLKLSGNTTGALLASILIIALILMIVNFSIAKKMWDLKIIRTVGEPAEAVVDVLSELKK